MARVASGRRLPVPTVDDLRVKLCYICREEEAHDEPSIPPKRWVHPCKCSLIAHESCLLEWIRTSELNPSKQGTLIKCPQCSVEYQWDSDNPWFLRVLDSLHGILNVCGRVVTVLSTGVVLFSFGAGLYVLCTGYGAFAAHAFVGDEMYDLLLTDDPANWPIMAWLNLPLIPVSLIIGQTPIGAALPLFPMISFWPSIPFNDTTHHRILDFVMNRPGGKYSGPLYWLFHDIFFSWPPSPMVCMFGLSFLKIMYRRALTHWRKRLLGTNTTQEIAVGPLVRRLMFENVNVEMRIENEVDAPAPAAPAAPGIPGERQEAGNQADGQNPAQLTYRLTGSSLGRLIGGALLLPSISNLFGAMLYRLSRHSSLLFRFLAIRPRGYRLPRPPGRKRLEKLSFPEQMLVGLTTGLSAFCCGTPDWRQADPVWWRNSIGLGLWIVATDCVSLWHEWMSSRELKSRRLRSRPFDDVDPAELDLLVKGAP